MKNPLKLRAAASPTLAINAAAKRKTLKGILHSRAFTIGYRSIEQVA